MGKEGTTKRTNETPKQALRRWGRVTAKDSPARVAKVDVQLLAQHFKFTLTATRAACQELVSEEGSGWHGGGNHYEFRLDERLAHRKPNDTKVTERALEFMRSTEPGAHIPLRDIAAAIGARNSSVSASMAGLVQDKWLFLVKVRKGVYSYRPPSYTEKVDPGSLIHPHTESDQSHAEWFATQLAEQEDRERDQRMLDSRPDGPTGIPVTPVILADLQRAREGQRTQWTHPANRPRDLTYTGDDMDTSYHGLGSDAAFESIPDGYYKQLTVTTSGTVLAEDAKGALYELVPLRRPT